MRQRHRHPPHKLKQRLNRQQQLWVYLTGGALLLSGVAWLACHYLLRAPGPAPHPMEVWWLRLHGAAMVGFLVVLGSLFPVHVKYGWRQGLNRGSGLPVVVASAVLALTGYGLYYLVDDQWRDRVGILHWAVGLAAVAMIGLHVVLGKQQARLRRRDAQRRLAAHQAARRAHTVS